MAPGKKYQPEQVLNLLRQIEFAVANGKSTEQACREAGISSSAKANRTILDQLRSYSGADQDQ